MRLASGGKRRNWGRISAAALGIGLSVVLAAPLQAQPYPPPYPPYPPPYPAPAPVAPAPAAPAPAPVAAPAPAPTRLSDAGVVNYAVLGKESLGLILNTRLDWERFFTTPYIDYWVETAACNNAAGVGLPEVFDGPGLIAFRGAEAMTGKHDDTVYVKQAVGVYGTPEQAEWAFQRVADRTLACNAVTTVVHYNNGPTKKWRFTRGPVTATDADWFSDLDGTDRRCYFETRRRQNVLLQIKACQRGNAGPAVFAVGNAMQSMLFQQ